MNAQARKIPTAALTFAMAVAFTAPVMAQDTMQHMDMPSTQGMQMPARKPAPKKQRHATKTPHTSTKPASASTSSTNMKPMPGMDMQHVPMSQPPQQPSPATSHSSMSGMQGMSMQPARPAEMQPLHLGRMIGTRPKPGGLASGMQGMDMPPMRGMDMSSMQGGNAPADARSPDYSDGYAYGAMTGMDMGDDARHGMLLLDQLEVAHSRNGGNAAVIDGEAWHGGDLDKLWLKFEGEHAGDRWQDLRTEALWDHAVATYWSTQLGARHDFGEGPGRTWAAFGMQGLAPYWFETEATFYVGQSGRTAARVQVEYDELLTQRLILQPRIEVNLYGKDDPQRGIGSGLSDAAVSVRLRYEIRREFAPYVGVVWRQQFGSTAGFARARGEHTDDLQFVAGFRIWF